MCFDFESLKKESIRSYSSILEGMPFKNLCKLSLQSFSFRIEIPNLIPAAHQIYIYIYVYIYISLIQNLRRNNLTKAGSLAGLGILVHAHCLQVVFNLAALGPCKF